MRAGSVDRTEALDEGAARLPGGVRWDGARAHLAAQISVQSQTYASFLSGVVHGVLLDHTGPRVTENAGRRGGRRFYLFLIII